MEAVLNEIAKLQLHPVADHFSVALLVIGVAIDLIANLAPSRAWIRYMALTLMILGALAAGASYGTGGMEAHRIWKALGQPARDVLHLHAELGEYLAITFGVLAFWRILVESFGFMAGSRGFYLLVAVVAILVLGYSAHLGGKLVYDYGAGTALMGSQPFPAMTTVPEIPSFPPPAAGPLATVSVPTPISVFPPPAGAVPPAPAHGAPPPAKPPSPAASPASPAPSATPSSKPTEAAGV